MMIPALDSYDLAVAGTALPAIMKAMGVEAATAVFMASSALFGMTFGAIALGTLPTGSAAARRSRPASSSSAYSDSDSRGAIR
jgi:MFS family permease